MTDIIRALEFMRDEPTAWVALLLVIVAFVWVLRDRAWWKDRALKMEEELRDSSAKDERVIAALGKLADMLHVLLDRNENRWFRRWMP